MTGRCERDFLAKLTAQQKRAYEAARKACDRKYARRQGTMSISFTAFCKANVARSYSRRFGNAAPAPRRQGPQAAFGSAALTFSTIAWNAAGSWIARSDSTLRSTCRPDLASPSMNRL